TTGCCGSRRSSASRRGTRAARPSSGAQREPRLRRGPNVSAATTRSRPAPRPRLERDRPRLTGRAAALLVAVAILVVMAIVPIGRYLDQRSAIADIERRAPELDSENAALRAEISRLLDPAELEALARGCLGMVRPGEVAFITPGRTSAPSDC